MLGPKGGMKKNKKHRSLKVRKMYGGHSPQPWSPYTLAASDGILGTSSTAGVPNFAESPMTIPTSTMVGGAGYGFDSASFADVPSAAGSYFPITKNCTAGAPDNNSRGGNNFSQGGGGDGHVRPLIVPVMKAGGGRRKKMWKQRGCSMGGKRSGSNKRRGSSKRRTAKKRHTAKRRRSIKRGGMPIM